MEDGADGLRLRRGVGKEIGLVQARLNARQLELSLALIWGVTLAALLIAESA